MSVDHIESTYPGIAADIQRMKRSGLSNADIGERIRKFYQMMEEAEYSREEIDATLGVGTHKGIPENPWKAFARGMTDMMTLGYYVPESLKKDPRVGPAPPGPFGIEAETLGSIQGGIAPMGLAMRIARPLVGARAGAGAMGQIAGAARTAGTAGAVTGAAHQTQGEGLEGLGERATRGAMGGVTGAVIGGALEAGAQGLQAAFSAAAMAYARRIMQQRTPPPSEVIRPTGRVIDVDSTDYEVLGLAHRGSTRKMLMGQVEPQPAGARPTGVTPPPAAPTPQGEAPPTPRDTGKLTERLQSIRNQLNPPSVTDPRDKRLTSVLSTSERKTLIDERDEIIAQLGPERRGVPQAPSPFHERVKPREVPPRAPIAIRERHFQDVYVPVEATEVDKVLRFGLTKGQNVYLSTDFLKRQMSKMKDPVVVSVAVPMNRLSNIGSYSPTLNRPALPHEIANIARGSDFQDPHVLAAEREPELPGSLTRPAQAETQLLREDSMAKRATMELLPQPKLRQELGLTILKAKAVSPSETNRLETEDESFSRVLSARPQRRVGTVEQVEGDEVEQVTRELREKGFLFVEPIPAGQKFDVMYARRPATDVLIAMDLYEKYLNGAGDLTNRTVGGLSLPQHEFLGKMFGLKQSEINTFKKEAGKEMESIRLGDPGRSRVRDALVQVREGQADIVTETKTIKAAAEADKLRRGSEFNITLRVGNKTFSASRSSEDEAQQFVQGVRESLPTAQSRQMQVAITEKAIALPKQRPAVTKAVEGRAPRRRDVEVPLGTTRDIEVARQAGTIPEIVRLPEEGVEKSFRQVLDQKGLLFGINRKSKTHPYFITEPGGQVRRLGSVSDMLDYAYQLDDGVPASLLQKVAKGQKLAENEKALMIRQGRTRKVADKSPVVTTDETLINEEAITDPPPAAPMSGGAGQVPGAQPMPFTDWLSAYTQQHVNPTTGQPDLVMVTPTGGIIYTSKGGAFVQAMNRVVSRNPDIEQDLRMAFESPRGRLVSWNPTDAIGQPQNILNKIIATAATEASDVEMARDFEATGVVKFYTENFAPLNAEEARLAQRVISGQIGEGTVNQRVARAAAAARLYINDSLGRLPNVGIDINEWSNFLSSVADYQKSYEIWRPILTRSDKFEDLEAYLQWTLRDPSVFDKVYKAFEKNDRWDTLPRDVRDIVRDRIMHYNAQAQYSHLPKAVQVSIPKELFQRFYTGNGIPFTDDLRVTMRALMPIITKHLHVQPFLDDWETIADELPGNRSNFWTEGFYLKRYLAQFAGKEYGGIDKSFDLAIRTVENQLGRQLADPQLLSRIATRSANWTYRGVLGLDSALLGITQSLVVLAESGTKPFMRGLAQIVTGQSERPDVGYFQNAGMFWAEGMDPDLQAELSKPGMMDKLAQIDDFVTRTVLSPMTFSESLQRGIGWEVAHQEAVDLGLNDTQALALGFARQSNIFPSIKMTEAALEATHRTAQTVYGYTPAFRSPFVNNPVMRMTTLLWSYPSRTVQLASNRIAEGLGNAIGAAKRGESMPDYRWMRYLALMGGLVGGFVWAGNRLGIDFNRITLDNPLARGIAGAVGLGLNVARGVSGKDPIGTRETWRYLQDALNIANPGHRYYWRQIPQGIQAGRAGFRVDDWGKETFETTPMGEFAKILGFDYGTAFNQRLLLQEGRYAEMVRADRRQNALYDYIMKDDPTTIDKYNEEYPELAITGIDINRAYRDYGTPLIDRTGPRFMRERNREKLEMGVKP